MKMVFVMGMAGALRSGCAGVAVVRMAALRILHHGAIGHDVGAVASRRVLGHHISFGGGFQSGRGQLVMGMAVTGVLRMFGLR